MNPEIVKICSVFVLDEIKEKQFMKTFRHQIQSGLKRKTHSEAEVKCFVTYVQDLPNGRESGKFLALDLGGTNFRVLLIQLTGNHKNFEMTSKIFAIPHSLMVGHGDLLFDYIAGCLSDFVVVRNFYFDVKFEVIIVYLCSNRNISFKMKDYRLGSPFPFH